MWAGDVDGGSIEGEGIEGEGVEGEGVEYGGVDDGLTERIIACIIRVHRTLGPGFVESIYRNALLIELRKCGLATDVERLVVIHYDGYAVGRHRVDLVVEEQIIVELKTVTTLNTVHYAQVKSYLKATNLDLALLVNFAGRKADFRRIECP